MMMKTGSLDARFGEQAEASAGHKEQPWQSG
jgi:hypothetical protein